MKRKNHTQVLVSFVPQLGLWLLLLLFFCSDQVLLTSSCASSGSKGGPALGPFAWLEGRPRDAVGLLHCDLDFGAQDLERRAHRFNGLEKGKIELEPLAIGHPQINVNLPLLELNNGSLAIHLLSKDRQVDVGLGLVPVVAAVDKLLNLLLLLTNVRRCVKCQDVNSCYRYLPP